jgi:predicted nuclease with TOPRIM domain
MTELQEEIKRKETRWTSSNSRLRSKIEQLEQENSELKEEIKLMEKRRLEWLQKEQNKVFNILIYKVTIYNLFHMKCIWIFKKIYPSMKLTSNDIQY